MEEKIITADQRIRSLRKKYNRILQLQNKISEGETLDEKKKRLIDSKQHIVQSLFNQYSYYHELVTISRFAAATPYGTASSSTSDQRNGKKRRRSSTDDQRKGKKRKQGKNKNKNKGVKKDEVDALYQTTEDHPCQREGVGEKKKRGKKKKNKGKKRDEVDTLEKTAEDHPNCSEGSRKYGEAIQLSSAPSGVPEQTQVESHDDDPHALKEPKRLVESEEAPGFSNDEVKRLRDDRVLMEKFLCDCESIVREKEVVKRYIDDFRDYIFHDGTKTYGVICGECGILKRLCKKLDTELNKHKADAIRAEILYLEEAIKVAKIPDINVKVSSDPNIVTSNWLRERIIKSAETKIEDVSDENDLYDYNWLPYTYQKLNMLKEELVTLESELHKQQMEGSLFEDQKGRESYELGENAESEVTMPVEEVEEYLQSLNKRLVEAEALMDLHSEFGPCLLSLHHNAHAALRLCNNVLKDWPRPFGIGGVFIFEDNETEPKGDALA